MKVRPFPLLIGLAALGWSGCGLVHSARDVLGHQVRRSLQDHAEQRRNRRLAQEAWEAVSRANSDLTADHGAGFRCGYEDHLWRGGNGQPPPLPPAEYRTVRYQTPEGYRAIEQWFAGYRHGAAAARASGQREWVTGPSSLRVGAPPVPAPTPAAVPSPAPAPDPPPAVSPALPPTTLPAPDPAGSAARRVRPAGICVRVVWDPWWWLE